MKKTIFLVCLVVSSLVLCTFLTAQPTFQVGLGGQMMPGQYDFALLSNYVDMKNNNGIELLDSDEVTPVTYMGVNAFASIHASNLMLMLSGSLNYPNKISITYDDTSSGTGVPHTIEHKALFLTTTLWIGPSIEIMNRGSIYLCTGPSFLYGEWGDKVDAGEANQSKDRQYKGMGIIFPFMLGGEGLMTRKIGVGLDLIMIAQQIILETFSKKNFDATDNTYNLITFPIGSGTLLFGTNPVIFLTRLSLVYHIN